MNTAKVEKKRRTVRMPAGPSGNHDQNTDSPLAFQA
jgi:hypothetical protein